MALALEGQQTGVLLLTGANQLSSLPLPVAQRIELRRQSPQQLELRIAKDRWGRVSGWRRVALDSGGSESAALAKAEAVETPANGFRLEPQQARYAT
jgi:hypothetical protein